MPRKTAKKTVKKTRVYKKHKEFDLSVKTEAQALELITHLEMLKVSAGWQILKQVIDGNIAVLERAILLKQDTETAVAITEQQADELRFKRNYLEELSEKPQKLIEQFKKQTTNSVPTYDPYATDIRQFQQGGRDIGAPMARTLTNE